MACGSLTDLAEISRPTSYVITLRQYRQDPLLITYEAAPDYFTPNMGCFGINCDGRIICGGGFCESGVYLRNVCEFVNTTC